MKRLEQTQSDVRRWWTDNPMTYDWHGEISHELGSPEYLADVERRFLAEAWFAQRPGAPPLSDLIPLQELSGKDVRQSRCGTDLHPRLLAATGSNVSPLVVRPAPVSLP